ncbi:MAG: acetyl-CoA carboxylase biotin carboxylase subunit [Bacteroidales bacterium]|nr:acetyl-CoA carboxylase biotin carboxylase subunit [Bacteroidales bacterium]
MKIFNKILIANRGEIAVRIIKAANTMGIGTVAVYSTPDSDALHTKIADEAYFIGEQELADSYLNVDKIISIAQQSNCEAIHPGYGFLSESPVLVKACANAGISFIGPSTKAIELMGNKVQSRAFVTELGVPMTIGATGTIEELKEAASKIPLPILVKAASGGGGKGMRIINHLDELEETIESTSREALSYFGDDEVFIEQFIENPRHIEIQILGDKSGNVVHLYERECSIQRRYQKIIEESPSPTLNQETREKMGKAAVDIAKAIDYDSAGTIEFLVDKNMNFYFLEMNTRIQVEHPVTELVTGIDLVREQILVAAGNELSFKQEDIKQNGHAIEARIYAEEPENDFRPSPGDISYYLEPVGSNLRIDAAIDSPTTIHSFFDPMISKLIAYGESRDIANERLKKALKNYIINGINTNIPFLIAMLQSSAFTTNNISTKFCDDNLPMLVGDIQTRIDDIDIKHIIASYLIYNFNNTRSSDTLNIWDNIGYWRSNQQFKVELKEKEYAIELIESDINYYKLQIDGKNLECHLKEIRHDYIRVNIDGLCQYMHISDDKENGSILSFQGNKFVLKRSDLLYDTDFFIDESDTVSGNSVKSPMPGKVLKIKVSVGDSVSKGESLLIVEAMKMENSITSPRDGIVEKINTSEGEMVDGNTILLFLEELIEEEEE